MKKLISILLISLLATTLLIGCSSSNNNSENSSTTVEEGTISKISGKEAKDMMESNTDVVLLDVREENEYREGHIQDSVLVPVNTISNDIENIINSKDTKIIVYCRSGKRSSNACTILQELGYKNIYDLGGIIDWPYDIVKS